MKQTIVVENMSCQNCVKHVTQHLLELNGVSAVEVNLETKEAVVDTAIQHDLEDFKASLEDTVYEATALK